MSTLPDVATVAKEIAKGLGNIRVIATCDRCREKWEAVMVEAPRFGLILIGKSGNSLEFAKEFYEEQFTIGHPQHAMIVKAEYTLESAHEPKRVEYIPELAE